MINEERSYTEYAVVVPTTDFMVGYDFIDNGVDITEVTLNGVDPTTTGYTVLQVNNTTYRFAPPVESGVVRLSRVTDIDRMAHVFTEGAIFVSENMDGNFKQIRHSQQEVKDAFSKLSLTTGATLTQFRADLDSAIITANTASSNANAAAVVANSAAVVATQAAADLVDTNLIVLSDGYADVTLTGGSTVPNMNKRILSEFSTRGYITEGTGGWGATSVIDGNQTQKEINLFGGKKYDMPVGGYPVGAVVRLDNGDIVKSTEPNNTKNPNIDMAGWLKVGNLIIVNTVTEMISKKLKNGDVVKTLGYNNMFDGGGALYVISNTATDYSILLSNGNHAVFNDDFDIRKFGIRDNATLDQTQEIKRMIAYADSRFYEIDFHNFEIMSPDILQHGKGNIPIRAMIFNHAHKLKNLKPVNNKSVQLQQDSSCIAFMPKHNPETIEVFELNNVVFDPYVANYNITAGYYDGNMHGFIAHPHIDSTDLIAWGTQPANFGFRFKAINFISPAISYNITPSAVFAQFIETDDISGEYIGCYINNHSNRHDFKNTHGVYRDDLHNPSRLLVTSLIHHEAEIAGGSIDIQGFNLDNISCIKHSNQTNYISFKLHALGTITINEVKANNVRGNFEFYAKKGNNSKVKDLLVSNSQELTPSLAININKTTFDNTPVNDLLFSSESKRYITCVLKDSLVNAGIIYDGCTLDELFLDRVTITNPTYGLVRAEAYIKEININDIRVSGGRFVFCKFDQIKGNGLTITDTPTVGGEFLQAMANTTPSAVKITGVKALVSTLGYFINKYAGHVLNADIRFSEFLTPPTFNVSTLKYEFNSPSLSNSVAFDPPSLANGARTSIQTIPVSWVKFGANISITFSNDLQGVGLVGYVSAIDTVSYYFENRTGATVDLASGTLTVKLI